MEHPLKFFAKEQIGLPNASNKRLFFFAGEPSGDVHGASLIEALLKKDPTLQIYAVAGPKMRTYPIHCIEEMERFKVMGFTDVVSSLPKLTSLFFSLRKTILQLAPTAVITIDYPGFCLRLQSALHRKKYPGKQIHYICPTVWAWGKARIQKMANTLDLGLCILPFEPSHFASTTLAMEYVGHPLTKGDGTCYKPPFSNPLWLFPNR